MVKIIDKECLCGYKESQHIKDFSCPKFEFNGWFLDENGICRHDWISVINS